MPKETDIRAMVERLKRGERGEKENITFRLSKSVISSFKEACTKKGIKAGATVEELMLLFIKETK